MGARQAALGESKWPSCPWTGWILGRFCSYEARVQIPWEGAGVGGGVGEWTRLPVQKPLLEPEIKHQLPKAASVGSNYWGVLCAAREPKRRNYSHGRRLFSAQEVGRIAPIAMEPFVRKRQAVLCSNWEPGSGHGSLEQRAHCAHPGHDRAFSPPVLQERGFLIHGVFLLSPSSHLQVRPEPPSFMGSCL